MGRRRVLVLAPAITRMQCMSNPYKRVEGSDQAPEKEPPSAVVRRTSSSFWSSWRKKKAAGKKRGGAPRRRGFRVTKLRIRMLSPLFWLKKVRDAYVDMMLTIEHSPPREHNSPRDCSGMVTYPAYMHQSQASRTGCLEIGIDPLSELEFPVKRGFRSRSQGSPALFLSVLYTEKDVVNVISGDRLQNWLNPYSKYLQN